MIAFSACVGIGLFLRTGKVIFLAGPGLATISYILAGTVMWSVIGSLGEMTALYPIQGSVFVLPARFLDVSVPESRKIFRQKRFQEQRLIVSRVESAMRQGGCPGKFSADVTYLALLGSLGLISQGSHGL